MALFVLIFLILYGGMNGYIYHTLVSGLGHHSWVIAGVLVVMVFAPILLRVSEGRVPSSVSKVIAWIGFNWMGVSFIFASIALPVDIAQLFLPELDQVSALWGISMLTVLAAVYGFVESRNVRIRILKVRSPKLSFAESKPFRLIQISDLHLGYGTLPGQVRKVVDKIATLQPDLLVSTGDLFDTDLHMLDPYVRQLGTLSPSGGKLAVTGNHEVYSGLEKTLELTKDSGFRVLRSEHTQVAAGLFVAGVDDTEALSGETRLQAEEKALREIPGDAFTILLKHRPQVAISSSDRVDLQLSGHTHGGQVFPFIFVTRLQYKARHGLSEIAESSYLYLSRGTGAWGPQMRLFAPPEITVFDLCHGTDFKIVLAG